ncbi:MAG TPA: hypothetical protein VJZ03_08135 [Candidatus Bathyarchaeia archaeon]|nr:hypothetical protein [Candidatus Bathyarchaeia archaeon]
MLSLHKDLAIILILIGGILGLLLALVALILVLFIAGIASYGYLMVSQYGVLMARYGMFGYPEFGSSLMTEVMFGWSLLGLVGSVLSIYCGLTLRKKWERNVVFTGLVGGFILLLAFSWLSSLLVLGGAILGYIEREAF